MARLHRSETASVRQGDGSHEHCNAGPMASHVVRAEATNTGS